MRLNLAIYYNESRDAVTETIPIPRDVLELKAIVEKHTSRPVRVMSFWNYALSQYDLLDHINQLLQPEAQVQSLNTSGVVEDNENNGGDTQRQQDEDATTTYRAQLWVESIWMRLENVDPIASKAEYEELAHHVRRFTGNAHVAFELLRATRVRYGYLGRMFDRARSTQLHSSNHGVQLLYYANNAWSTADVLQHGFQLLEHVPKGGVGEVKDTDEAAVTSAAQRGNSLAFPFCFTSSMVSPKDRKPAIKDQQKVILCEVAPGKTHRVHSPLLAAEQDKREGVPDGYDSLLYRFDVQSNKEQPRLIQLQVSVSHQALPRYLLTVQPTKQRSESPSFLKTLFGLERCTDGGSGVRQPSPTTTATSANKSNPPAVAGILRRSPVSTRSKSAEFVAAPLSHNDSVVSSRGYRTPVPNRVSPHRSSGPQRRPTPTKTNTTAPQGGLLSPPVLLPGAADSVSMFTGVPVSMGLNDSTGRRPSPADQQHGQLYTNTLHTPTRHRTTSPGSGANRYEGILQQHQHQQQQRHPLPAALIPGQRSPSRSATTVPMERPPLRPMAVAAAAFRCSTHPDQFMSLYCNVCRDLICPYCASVGAHRDHDCTEAESHATHVRSAMQEVCHGISQMLDHFSRIERQLHAERQENQKRHQQRILFIRGQVAELRRTLDERERALLAELKNAESELIPPAAEATKLREKASAALQPLERCLQLYQASRPPGTNPGSSSLTAPPASTSRIQSQLPSMQFLRASQPLLATGQTFARDACQREERHLQELIEGVKLANEYADRVMTSLNVPGVRRSLADSASSSHAALAETSTMSHRPTLFIKGGGMPTNDGRSMSGKSNGLMVTPLRYDEWASTSPPRSGRVLAGGDSPSRYSTVSNQRPRDSVAVDASLMCRCLQDLQRGHIWSIHGASKYFCSGQNKAVCSTAFKLRGADWELRIAPLPSAPSTEPRTGWSVGPDKNSSAGADTSSRPQSQTIPMLKDPAPHTPLENGAPTTAASQDVNVSTNSDAARLLAPQLDASDEGQWLGIFLFPLGHRMRMDFRVIAFSEVAWTEWRVSGWKEGFVGKGWGLYPFLQRKDLMRSDKLAKDNTVKICVSPISDLY